MHAGNRNRIDERFCPRAAATEAMSEGIRRQVEAMGLGQNGPRSGNDADAKTTVHDGDVCLRSDGLRQEVMWVACNNPRSASANVLHDALAVSMSARSGCPQRGHAFQEH